MTAAKKLAASEEVTYTVFKALSNIQRKLSEVGIAKGGTNTYDNYKFRGIDQVLNALSPILAEEGVLIIPSIANCTTTQVQTSAGKLQNHTVVHIDYTLYDSMGDSITHRAVGEAMDRGDKSINKAMSAAFKYFLFQTFMIPLQGSDADAESHEIVDQAPLTPESLVPSPASLMPATAPIVPQISAPVAAVSTPVAPVPATPANNPNVPDTGHTVIGDQSAATDTADVLINIAEKMHSTSLPELREFWDKNKATLDALKTSWPADFERVKVSFNSIRTKLTTEGVPQ